MTDDLHDPLAPLRAAEDRLQGRLGVHASRLDGSDPVAYHAEETFPSASTIKVYVLQTLFERVAAGELRLDQERVLRADDQVTGSGVLKSLAPDRPYTLHDLARLMIIVSDNTATNLLIDTVGLERVNAAISSHGWRDSHLAGLLQRTTDPEGNKTSASVTSPRDLHDYFRRLWAGELLDARLTAAAQAIYRDQQFTDQLGRYLPFDPYSTEIGQDDVRIASKSGSIRGVRNDAGVIEGPRGAFVLAIMTRGCPDTRFHPDNLGSVVLSEVARALYRHYLG